MFSTLYRLQAGLLWNVFQGDALCPGTSSTCPALPCGQRCLYDFVSVNENEIKATHTTPVARLVGVFLARSVKGQCRSFIDKLAKVNYQLVNQGYL